MDEFDREEGLREEDLEEATQSLVTTEPVDRASHVAVIHDSFGERYVNVALMQERAPTVSVLRELGAGNSVAMLCDQRRRNRALILDFFGRPAATLDTPAVLALRFGIPVVPGFSWRSGEALEYRAYLDTPILPDPSAPRDAEVMRISQEINDSIERFVRAHPDQWNWTQPRWKISPRMRRRARVRNASTGEAELPASP